MRYVVEVSNIPTKESVLVFSNGQWVAIPRNIFMEEVETLKIEIAKTKADFETELVVLKNSINDKLKDYHDIIQNLLKGE